MIIKNEIERGRFIRELLRAELPCEVLARPAPDGVERLRSAISAYDIKYDLLEYPDTPEPTLGDHTSGMEDCCE